MRIITFTSDDRQALAYDRYHHPDPRVQRKMEVLWLKSHGLNHDDIAAYADVSLRTVQRYLDDYLEGGLTGKLMAKDILLYLEHVARLGVPSLTGPACLATFELTNALGYADQISNRVVDGLGDLAGGVRVHD